MCEKAIAGKLPAASSKNSGIFFKPLIQPKLSINQPNDIYEQEADAMADHVMRMPDPSAKNSSFFHPAITPIQRKCAHCEEEEKKAQRKENSNSETVASPQTENYINTASGGKSLSQSERNFFEPRFGYDFSNVQLHTNAAANESAKGINALAYTSGNNIVFGANQYQPQTDSGKRLMAHELTHVVQQNKNIQPKKIQRSCSDGNCESCAGGKKDFWITFYFRRRATTETMRKIRDEINNTKTILEKCCLTLKADFNWTLLPGGGTFNFIDTTTDPARWHYSTDASNLGTGTTFADSKGLPILVVDDVPASGGGVTVDTRFDPNYTGRTYAVLGINQTTTPNTGCTHLAHELWHVGSGIVGHDPVHGTLASCTGNSISPEYCSGLRTMVGA